MLDNLKTNDAIEHEGDSLGGSYTVPTNAYKLACDMAYFDKSAGGAMSFNVTLKGPKKETVKQTWWVASGDTKGNQNFYVDKKGKEHYLPDFSAANNFCLLACGKEISELKTEEKMINLYDFTERKEVPTKKMVAMELLSKDVVVAVEKQIVDKTAATGEQDDKGKPIYAPTGETREQNVIVKSFSAKDNRSAAEIRAEVTTAEFLDAWVEKNKDNVNDLSVGVTDEGTDGAPVADDATPAGTTQSLF